MASIYTYSYTLSILVVNENISEKKKYNIEEQFYGHFIDLDIDD
jgi:hypothetical protein